MRLMRSMHLQKLTILFILLVLFIVVIFLNKINVFDEWDQNTKLMKIEESIRNQALVACKQPVLPINSPEIMKFVKEVPPIDCSKAGIDWVTCENFECHINEVIRMQKGLIECSFTDILRKDDYNVFEGDTVTSDSNYMLKASDMVKVNCKSLSERWSSVQMGIRFDKDVWDRSGWHHVPDNALRMNVLMFGFDSVSRNTFIRKLPKSYKYFTEVMKGIVLEGYNIIGDGTPQALTPILTGKTELELPDVRKRYPNTQHVNVYPFIWNDFKNAGYVTAFLEDLPSTGIYQYRLRGFKETPTDHYIRPYYLSVAKSLSKWPKLCVGSVPSHVIMMNYIKQFFQTYKSRPKFLFGFHGELSHDDYNLIGVADEDLKSFFTSLEVDGVLNNTVLIVMADHGHRFAQIRNTIQGKQEERLPFFAFRFPTWFTHHYKKLYKNFLSNANKLTTPFDIYATLKNMLNLHDADDINLKTRSISLFRKIPAERSCADAYIEPHWCACLDWTTINLSTPIIQRLSNIFEDTINEYTKPNRDLCAHLQVAEVIWATKLRPNQNLLKFSKNTDVDGFVPDLSSNMALKSDTYQMKALVMPGDSIFEMSISHHLATDDFTLKMSDVSRVNKYGSQARCIENVFPNLRKYCYCRV